MNKSYAIRAFHVAQAVKTRAGPAPLPDGPLHSPKTSFSPLCSLPCCTVCPDCSTSFAKCDSSFNPRPHRYYHCHYHCHHLQTASLEIPSRSPGGNVSSSLHGSPYHTQPCPHPPPALTATSFGLPPGPFSTSPDRQMLSVTMARHLMLGRRGASLLNAISMQASSPRRCYALLLLSQGTLRPRPRCHPSLSAHGLLPRTHPSM